MKPLMILGSSGDAAETAAQLKKQIAAAHSALATARSLDVFIELVGFAEAVQDYARRRGDRSLGSRAAALRRALEAVLFDNDKIRRLKAALPKPAEDNAGGRPRKVREVPGE